MGFDDKRGEPHCDEARLIHRMTSEFDPGVWLVGPERDRYAIDGRSPSVVVRPATVVEIGAALRIAAEANAAVAPWGGGTQMSLGYPLTRYDVAISLERLTAIIDHDTANQSVTVQAGSSVASLNAALAPQRQFAALEGSLPGSATVGGRLATGSTGLRRGAVGNVRDLVLSLGVVGSDGRTINTGGASRYASGYDLNKLFVGSLGTLGIIVTATLRLHALPEHEGVVIVSFAEATDAWPMFADLRAAQLAPQAMVLCGPGALGVGRGLSEAAADLLHPASRALLLVRLAGTPDLIRRQALVVRQIALKFGAEDRSMLMLWDEVAQPTWAALENLAATRDLTSTEAVIKVAALPSEVGQVIEMARGFGAEYNLRMGWIADTNAGLAWLRLIGDEPSERVSFASALSALQAILARRWRNAVVLGCPPSLKSELPLWGADPQGLELMRAIKSHFDPPGILNPGRFVGHI